MKMEPIVGSETSAFKTKTPGNYPKENILHIEHGESLKSRRIIKSLRWVMVNHKIMQIYWLAERLEYQDGLYLQS